MGPVDLVVAAERHRVTVLHDDADADLAEIMGQQVQWVVPRGCVG